MNPAPQQQRHVEANRQEYGDRYGQLHFPAPAVAVAAEQRRAEYLRTLAGRALTGCHGTKLDMRNLSPGCRICVEGKWSCLFINGRCNARCFYCPATQDQIGLPTTNTVDFRTPADYVAYLERFDFSGAGISGGEPLLTPERSLSFIRTVKRHFQDRMHVWLYTNGILVDRDILARLRDAGLDEIRFDIGATNYQLDKLRLAVGVIPTVTVEIPAVPEESERMKRKLLEMREIGVNHLNLHQLRLTPYNFPHFVRRNYTYLHGEKVTVLESELTALDLLCFSLEHDLTPINYCSFVYKNRYQAWAARRRNGAFVGKSFESLTAAGYLRTLTLLGSPDDTSRLTASFETQKLSGQFWLLNKAKDRLTFHPCLWPLIDFSAFSLRIDYSTSRQAAAVSYRNPFTAVKIGPRKQVIVERAGIGREVVLSGDAIAEFYGTFLQNQGAGEAPPTDDRWQEIVDFERLKTGLQRYY